jgi:hypothetical protein
VQLRVEANWRSEGGDEWDVGTDIALLERMAAELRVRLGKQQQR